MRRERGREERGRERRGGPNLRKNTRDRAKWEQTEREPVYES